MVNLSAEDKLIKARIELLKEKPFFAFLANHLDFKPEEKMETMGVDIKGSLYYNSKFVEGLSREECKGVICHEVMHLALEHFKRHRGKNCDLWNVSGDAAINQILTTDGLQLPKDGIIPSYNEITLFGIKISDLDKRCAEDIYDYYYSRLKDKELKDLQSYLKNHPDSKKGFDVHIYPSGEGEGKEGKDKKEGLGNQLGNGQGKDWNKIMVDACTFARNQGKLPAGMDRLLGDLLKTDLDWRGILYRYISNQIPVDYSWSRPSKKSFSTGTYLPSVTKGSLDLVIAIDTSGSISKTELTEFMGEVLGIINSFSNVSLTILDCDAEVNSVIKLQRATMDDIINIRLKGGGGTSHIPVYNWLDENIPNAKLVICFTDGYTTFPKASSIPTLWVVAGHSREKEDKFPFGDVVYLERNDNR
jgi:predicted metal-dependent peptidase